METEPTALLAALTGDPLVWIPLARRLAFETRGARLLMDDELFRWATLVGMVLGPVLVGIANAVINRLTAKKTGEKLDDAEKKLGVIEIKVDGVASARELKIEALEKREIENVAEMRAMRTLLERLTGHLTLPAPPPQVVMLQPPFPTPPAPPAPLEPAQPAAAIETASVYAPLPAEGAQSISGTVTLGAVPAPEEKG